MVLGHLGQDRIMEQRGPRSPELVLPGRTDVRRVCPLGGRLLQREYPPPTAACRYPPQLYTCTPTAVRQYPLQLYPHLYPHLNISTPLIHLHRTPHLYTSTLPPTCTPAPPIIPLYISTHCLLVVHYISTLLSHILYISTPSLACCMSVPLHPLKPAPPHPPVHQYLG